jgi:hypothetical protein
VSDNTGIDYFDRDGVISDAELSTLSVLAAKQVDLERQIASMEEQLKKRKGELYKLSTETIPAFMNEIGAGVSSLTLTNGASINIRQTYYASISEERRAAAHNWLRSHDFDGIIKNTVIASFGKGEDEKANEALRLLMEQDYAVERKETVHPQTLKSFIRELYEKGVEFPAQLFGAGVVNVSTVTLPKKDN